MFISLARKSEHTAYLELQAKYRGLKCTLTDGLNFVSRRKPLMQNSSKLALVSRSSAFVNRWIRSFLHSGSYNNNPYVPYLYIKPFLLSVNQPKKQPLVVMIIWVT